MKKATFVNTVPLDWISLPDHTIPWETYETDDIIAESLITVPDDYMLTLGSSGVYSAEQQPMVSLATTPAYPLPTTSQMYVAGRDVIRWGGKDDPFEIDFDRYVFTPDQNKGVAIISKAPKSEPHHFSDVPTLIDIVSEGWKEIFEGITRGDFA